MRLTFAVSIVVSLLSVADVAAQSDASLRRAQRSPGVPVVDLMRPSENEIIVVDTTPPPLQVSPLEGVSTIDWRLNGAGAVLLVQAQSVESSLTAGQDWVISSVTSSVIEVLKKPSWWDGAPGSTMSLSWSGGEALVQGKRVIAVVPWARPLEAGKQYLLFFTADDSTKSLVTGPSAAYELTESLRFRSLGGKISNDDIDRLPSEEVLDRIRGGVKRDH